MPTRTCTLFFFTVLLAVVISSSSSSSVVNAGGSPWLRGNVDQCFSNSITDSDICFPTRCEHLFNRSTSVIIPTPLNASTDPYPYTYATFQCVVETVYEYNSAALNIPCKKARCECTSGPNNGQTCYPTDKMGCASHSCPAS